MKKRLLIYCFSIFFLLTSSLNFFVFAQGTEPDNTDVKTNPKEGSMYVSATVLENTPPTTPILISPQNNSYVTVNPPTFIWQGSTDNYGVDYYQLWVDGDLLFDNIPAADVNNSQYTLDYEGSNNRFTLTPKSGLDQGSHTWKIRVYDIYHGDYSDSATWTFIIDTQAPSFVVTQVGSEIVSISAQDIDTIPTDPIQLEENQPLIVATGEANSTVVMTVTIPGDPTQTYTVAIDGSGNWQQQLPTLPRNEIISLDFVITDLAGNISVLNGIQLIILAETIVIPPASPSPTPTPGVTPIPSPITTPPPSPAITIPLLPPSEYVEEIIQEIQEVIPAPIAQVVSQVPTQVDNAISRAIKTLAPSSSLAVSLAIPAFSLLSLLSQLGWDFSWKILLRLLQAIGLLPKKDPQGIVFNSQTNQPVAFALLTVTSYPPDTENAINETVVTDTEGIYQGLKLPKGKYTIIVSHQDYIFPTAKNRPNYLPFEDFYKGEVFEVKNESQDKLFLIPIDPIKKGNTDQNWRALLKIIIARIRLKNLTLPLFIFSLIITLIYPTVWNWIIVGFYILLLIKQTIKAARIPSISGEIIDQQGLPIENAIVRISTTDSNKLIAITHSDSNGNFSVFIDKGVYQINATKQGYIWMKKGSSISFQQIDNRQSSQYIVIDMSPADDIYAEMFS